MTLGRPQDITQALSSLKALASLARPLEDLDAIMSALNEFSIVATTDKEGTITSVNAKFCDISKYEASELIGKNHRILNSGLHPSSFWKTMFETVSGGFNWHGVVRNRAKDGTYYWVDTIIAPFETGYIAIRHDITTLMEDKEKNFQKLEVVDRKLTELVEVKKGTA